MAFGFGVEQSDSHLSRPSPRFAFVRLSILPPSSTPSRGQSQAWLPAALPIGCFRKHPSAECSECVTSSTLSAPPLPVQWGVRSIGGAPMPTGFAWQRQRDGQAGLFLAECRVLGIESGLAPTFNIAHTSRALNSDGALTLARRARD